MVIFFNEVCLVLRKPNNINRKIVLRIDEYVNRPIYLSFNLKVFSKYCVEKVVVISKLILQFKKLGFN